jgi:hypothetical protein
MPVTYEPIATNTLGSATGTITFSSIPSTYTDLVLITSTKYTSTASHCLLQFNSDSNTNYSNTFLYGDGSSALSGRQINTTASFIGRANTTEFGLGVTHIQNYGNSTIFKTVLSRGNLASSLTIVYSGLWRNTNAITSLSIVGNAGDTFTTGSTFTLYGIKAA